VCEGCGFIAQGEKRGEERRIERRWELKRNAFQESRESNEKRRGRRESVCKKRSERVEGQCVPLRERRREGEKERGR
jgi:hypothetical protein